MRGKNILICSTNLCRSVILEVVLVMILNDNVFLVMVPNDFTQSACRVYSESLGYDKVNA